MKTKPLIQLMRDSEDLDDFFVYKNVDTKSYFADTIFLLLDQEEDMDAAEDSDETVVFEGRTYRAFLSGQTVTGILENARNQSAELSDNQLIQAFAYYAQNDAFWIVEPV